MLHKTKELNKQRTCYPWDSILVQRRRRCPCDWCSTGQWWHHRSYSQTTTLASLAGMCTKSRLQTVNIHYQMQLHNLFF